MESITLPMILTDLSLEDAFDTMKSAGRSGIVWQKSPDEFRLYTAADVVVNIASGETHLGQLPGEEVELPDIPAVAKATPEPYIDTERLAASLSLDKGYGLLAAGQYKTQLRATLIVRTAELLANLEPAPEDCYCAKGHPGPRGGTCPRDGTKIRCR